MVDILPWFERTFPSGLPLKLLPTIVERLRGTRARAESRLADVPRDKLVKRRGHTWTIQEHVGHLLDVEFLWATRLDDFVAGRSILTEADLTNRSTWDANHNASDLHAILQAFGQERQKLVQRIESMPDEKLMATALHPRLKTSMSVVDFSHFVAEHDPV